MIKYTELWNKIKNLIEYNSIKASEYEQDFMKIKFNLYVNLPLNKMLEYDRIDISEGIYINKTNASEECDICYYWYFKDIGFKYEPYLCNGCHDLVQKAMNFNDVAVVSVKGSNYRILFWYMSKDGGINIMNNLDLNDKNGNVIFFFHYI